MCQTSMGKAMEVIKIMLIITITMAFSITFTIKSFEKTTMTKGTLTKAKIETITPLTEEKEDQAETVMKLLPSRSLSRILVDKAKNPRSESHCNKKKKICETMYGKRWECCNNKCVDLGSDKQNCGGCKKKCKYMAECCRGQCVDVAYDKRHCGRCNNPCKHGKFCVYGMCEYA